MYAVIKAGGKQHKVKAGDVLEIELMHGAEGEAVTFTPLLVVDDDGTTHFGKDAAKAVVKAKLVGEQKGDKIRVFKYRPKSGYAKSQGHRQVFTLIEIEDVSLGSRATAKKAADKEEEKPSVKKTTAKPAARAPRKSAARPSASATSAPKRSRPSS